MVNIIGAGLAGLSAAIALAERGIESNLISQQPSERAQSVLAEGGINAALDTMGEGDAWQEHYADTMRGGCDLADPNAVAGLTSHAPEIVRRLASLGVPFQREGGRIVQRNFGGQKKKRTAYAQSSTGKALMTALIDEARKYEAAGFIHRYAHHELIGLEIENGTCYGAKLWDTYADAVLRCGAPVVLACGGLNGLFPGLTTGAVYNTGGAAALAFAKGAALANPEMIQYHPTTVRISGKRMLVSEAARGEGGRLYVIRSGKPWYFMEELYPELGNLMPRDVVSRAMTQVCAREDCEAQVYLDMTCLSAETWANKLPDLRAELLRYLALDPKTQPIPVSPGIHFFMGGLSVDERHGTSVSGLYAAGECACQYHGANRLGGNSMLAAIYGGSVVAENAAAGQGGELETLGAITAEEKAELAVSPAFANRLRDILLGGLGIVRDASGIERALQAMDKLPSKTTAERNRASVGRAMLLGALARKESRGAHWRSDFPQRDEAFRKTTVATYTNGAVELAFQAIPERRAEL
ncbi:MAG: FAD-binding protein [Oscillospiraceae bacterium]|nr:FAD-binding protein [Oscillospiraceae bacterium]